MKRLIINDLIKWKNSTTRKPLILNGARQVGKTWVLRHFGESHYDSVAYVNCERSTNLDAVFRDFDTTRIIRALSTITGVDIVPERTLIIIDEIQEYPRALTALKYFCEDAPRYHVAVAGSLLGIALHTGVSFPVGKVETMQLYPMTFDEFLMALGHDRSVETLHSGDWTLINSLHEHYVELLRQYYYVGGMPGVVQAYVDGTGPNALRAMQQQILSDYSADFSKHATAHDVPRITMVWNSIPHQLARENKKFLYSELRKGGRASEYEMAIEWLLDAGLIYKVKRVTKALMPLRFYEQDNVFKLFSLDVGLLGAQMDVPASNILVSGDVFNEYKGAFTEAFVLSQLMATRIATRYYSRNDSQVEVDFVVQTADRIIPIEVKAEENVRSKSLRLFIDNNQQLKGLRISMRPYVDQGWMENIPLYATEAYFRRFNGG